MKTFAIFVSSGIGPNQGGPSGYVYNLLQGAGENGDTISIITPNMNISTVKNRSASNVTKRFGVVRSLLYIAKTGFRCRKLYKRTFDNLDVVHVHSSQDLYYLRKYIGFKGKIVFTPHRPEPYANEFINSYKLTFNKQNTPRILVKKANGIEKYSYQHADCFIFPSPHARDIYLEFPGFAEHGQNRPTDYLITGAPQKKVNISREQYRTNLRIDTSAFLITYIGRHNEVKGYDLLASISDELSENDIFTVCAGNTKGADIPQSEKWFELGYIDNAPDLMNASDVVVIPNRNTYFDLVIIEALSLGKIVITSETGGNIDIAQHTKGLVLFKASSAKDLLDTILRLSHMPTEERKKLEKDAYDYYSKYCTPREFAKAYKRIINKIVDAE